MMRQQYLGICFAAIIASALAAPQIFQRLPRIDVATAADVHLNTVGTSDEKAKVLPASEIIAPQKNAALVELTTARTLTATSEPPLVYPKPLEPGMFARFITDIFQIPISVLQSVTKLLTNPFLGAKKDSTEAAI